MCRAEHHGVGPAATGTNGTDPGCPWSGAPERWQSLQIRSIRLAWPTGLAEHIPGIFRSEDDVAQPVACPIVNPLAHPWVVLQHVPLEGPGLITPDIERAGGRIEVRRMDLGDSGTPAPTK
jgi:hypothetical protein